MNLGLPPLAIAADIGSSASGETAPTSALQQQFSELMNRIGPAGADVNEPSAVGRVLQSQDAAMRANIQQMNDLAQARIDGTMSREELSERSIEMQWQVVTVGFQFNACTFVAQSTKAGFQTLIKNQ